MQRCLSVIEENAWQVALFCFGFCFGLVSFYSFVKQLTNLQYPNEQHKTQSTIHNQFCVKTEVA